MKTKILKGTDYQNAIFNEIKNEILEIKMKINAVPGIAFIACVGHLPLMKYTIALHDQAAKGLGFNTKIETLPHTTTEEELFEVIENLNQNDTIQSIVLLQPLPKHLNAFNSIERINRNKEIEGFHPNNVINTLTKGFNKTKYSMCLPTAVLELFKSTGVEVNKGQEFVFVADQDFISDPFRSLILRTASSQLVPSDCSFTIVNSDNTRIKDFCKRADFLFVISENPEFIEPKWLKSGVCILDVYSNLINEIPSKKDPNMLIPVIRGGVNTNAVINIAGSIAPCPGGLMPVLLAVLLRNALIAFKGSNFYAVKKNKSNQLIESSV